MKKNIFFIEGASHVRYPEQASKNVGGSAVSLYELVKGLNRERYRPVVFFYYQSPVIGNLEKLNVQVKVLGWPSRARHRKKAVQAFFGPRIYSRAAFYKLFFLQMLPDFFRWRRLLRKEKPDLVHCNMSFVAQLAPLLASRSAGIPCLCHLRAFEELRFIHKACAPFVRTFLCVSEAVREHYILQGICRERLAVVYNGVDVQRLDGEFEEAKARDHFTVLQMGRMVGWKGHRILLQAIPAVLRQVSPVRFLLAGDGPLREKLEELAVRLRVENHVKFCGTVPEIGELLSQSDIVVNPSVEPEPFGRTLIEAMARGRPVIATAMGGPLEIITPKQDGFLIEPGKPDLLAEKIVCLLKNEDVRRRVGEAAKKTVRERFDHAQTVKKIEGIYTLTLET